MDRPKICSTSQVFLASIFKIGSRILGVTWSYTIIIKGNQVWTHCRPTKLIRRHFKIGVFIFLAFLMFISKPKIIVVFIAIHNIYRFFSCNNELCACYTFCLVTEGFKIFFCRMYFSGWIFPSIPWMECFCVAHLLYRQNSKWPLKLYVPVIYDYYLFIETEGNSVSFTTQYTPLAMKHWTKQREKKNTKHI